MTNSFKTRRHLAVGARTYARRRVAEVEGERSAFLRQDFRAEFADLTSFDLTVNTGALGIEGAVAAIRGALAARTLG